MAGRVDSFLGGVVLRRYVLNGHLSGLGEQSLAFAEIDTPGAGALPHHTVTPQ